MASGGEGFGLKGESGPDHQYGFSAWGGGDCGTTGALGGGAAGAAVVVIVVVGLVVGAAVVEDVVSSLETP